MTILRRGPNWPDIAHLGILVKADGDHLAVPYCKKSKWLNAKTVLTQNWYNSIERFFSFILCYF